MGFGFLIARFALLIREYALIGSHTTVAKPMMSTWLGFGMVCAGVAVSLIAAFRHHAYVSALERGISNPPLNIKTSLIVAVTLAMVGLAIAVHILML
jgi:uncharacterized membrane protein YidH (DUF202 family)